MSELADIALGRRKPSGKVYTDADVRKWTAGPGEEVGPWTDVPRSGATPKKSGSYFGPGNEDIQPVDWEGDIERSLDVLRDANLMSRRINNVGGTKTQAEGALEQDARDGYKQAFVTAPLVGASFAGGPVGSAAMAALLGESAYDFAEDPSVGNAVGMGLSALPLAGKGISALRGARAAAKEAEAVNGIRGTYGAGDMGAFQRGMPKPGGQMPVGRDITEAIPYTPGVGSSKAGPVARGMTQGNASNQAKSVIGGLQGGDFPGPQAIEEIPASIQGLGRTTGTGWGQSMLDDLRTAEVGPKNNSYGYYAEAAKNPTTPEFAATESARIAADPRAQRVPTGVGGDEFAGVQPYGKATELSPEEAAAEDEFWNEIMGRFAAFAR